MAGVTRPAGGSTTDEWTGQTEAVGDIGADGRPVLIHYDAVFDLASGEQVGQLDGFDESESWFLFSTAIADADGDGTMEIATRGSLLDAAGARVWEASGNWEDSYAVAVQADTDELPEFLFIRDGWKLVDSDGTEINTVHLGASATDASPPVVADFDGDGEPEIATSSASSTDGPAPSSTNSQSPT